MSELPERVVVGANGAYWRDFGTHYSMCPVSEDNDPVEVVATYVRLPAPDERQAGLRDTAAADFAAAAALAEVLHVSVDWATTILAAMPGYRLVPAHPAEAEEKPDAV